MKAWQPKTKQPMDSGITGLLLTQGRGPSSNKSCSSMPSAKHTWHRDIVAQTWGTNDANGPPKSRAFSSLSREKSWKITALDRNMQPIRIVSEQSPSDKSGPKRRVEDWSVKWKVSWPKLGVLKNHWTIGHLQLYVGWSKHGIYHDIPSLIASNLIQTS